MDRPVLRERFLLFGENFSDDHTVSDKSFRMITARYPRNELYWDHTGTPYWDPTKLLYLLYILSKSPSTPVS